MVVSIAQCFYHETGLLAAERGYAYVLWLFDLESCIHYYCRWDYMFCQLQKREVTRSPAQHEHISLHWIESVPKRKPQEERHAA